MRLRMRPAVGFLLLVVPSAAAQLTPPAERAFEQYVAIQETRLAKQHASPNTYLASLNVRADKRADAEHELRSGNVLVQAVNGGTWEVSGGLLHHWRGAIFVHGVKPGDMLMLLRDYNHLSRYYAPQIESSRVLTDNGNIANIAMRLREEKVVTVVLDAEYEVQTGAIGNSRGYGISRSTHIWQVDAPGTAQERRRAEDQGFLWRLNSYWGFRESADGLLVECEAVSLTRDIPAGLGWLIRPIIEDFPRESVQFTLGAAKRALAANAVQEAH